MSTLFWMLLIFGGMVFLHELGHFVAARFFKIPVEEFGFGLPPRLWRFWRARGEMVVDAHTIIIPANTDLPFERGQALHRVVEVSAESADGKLILESIALATSEDGQYRAPVAPTNIAANGVVKFSGVVKKLDPGTEFTFNWLPLGGFVRPRGEDNPDVPDGLSAAPAWQRIVVLLSGPLMNLATAVVIFAIIIAQNGIATPGVIIAEVSPNSPAQASGLVAQDAIKLVNGQEISDILQMQTIIRANIGQPIEIIVTRNGQEIRLNATPRVNPPEGQGALGVLLSQATRPATLSELFTGGLEMTGTQSMNLLTLPYHIYAGNISAEAGRPVGLKGIFDVLNIALERDAQAREQAASAPIARATPPANWTLSISAILSVSLGIINLLPIPALDGGRILFALPELLFRRRIPPRFEMAAHGFGFLLLIGLMIFINVLDFIKPVNFQP